VAHPMHDFIASIGLVSLCMKVVAKHDEILDKYITSGNKGIKNLILKG
jgi:hypothetical protein